VWQANTKREGKVAKLKSRRVRSQHGEAEMGLQAYGKNRLPNPVPGAMWLALSGSNIPGPGNGRGRNKKKRRGYKRESKEKTKRKLGIKTHKTT